MIIGSYALHHNILKKNQQEENKTRWMLKWNNKLPKKTKEIIERYEK